ncbi:hypothetical protein THAOC_25913, partial [Thalassiosira oceanica]
MARSEHADHPLAKLINAFFVLAPAMIKAASSAHALYKRLPIEQIYFIWGTVLCFFGGCYPTTFAALQAADHGGLQTLGVAIRDLSEEVIVIVEENKKDDREDLDGDGVPDAKQVEGKGKICETEDPARVEEDEPQEGQRRVHGNVHRMAKRARCSQDKICNNRDSSTDNRRLLQKTERPFSTSAH